MKKIFEIENIGTVEAYQNWLTGRFSFSVNQQALTKTSKNLYEGGEGEKKISITLQGNVFNGYKFSLNEQQYSITEPIQWYLYILACIPFVMTMVLGNSQDLAKSGFYYVGGAVGGGISGLFSGITLLVFSYTPNKWKRILIALVSIALTFAVCFGIGNMIASSQS